MITYETEELRRVCEGYAPPDTRLLDITVRCPVTEDAMDSEEDKLCHRQECLYGICELAEELGWEDDDGGTTLCPSYAQTMGW